MTREAAAMAKTTTIDAEMMETQVEKMVNEMLEELKHKHWAVSISPTWVPVSVSFYISPPKMRCFMYCTQHSIFWQRGPLHHIVYAWWWWCTLCLVSVRTAILNRFRNVHHFKHSRLVLRRRFFFFNSCSVWYFRLYTFCSVANDEIKCIAQLDSGTVAKYRLAVNVKWYLNPCKPKIRYTS